MRNIAIIQHVDSIQDLRTQTVIQVLCIDSTNSVTLVAEVELDKLETMAWLEKWHGLKVTDVLESDNRIIGEVIL